MKSFNVYMHPIKGTSTVKVGFCWPALFFGPLWMLSNKLGGWFLLWLAIPFANSYLYSFVDKQQKDSGANALIAFTWAVVYLAWILIPAYNGNEWRERHLLKKGYTFVTGTDVPGFDFVKIFKLVGSIATYLYLFIALGMVPYLNWQYAKENGFLKWVLMGEIIATVKAPFWPYLAYKSYDSGFVVVKNPDASVQAKKYPREVKCQEPVPTFSLADGPRLTASQQSDLCSCIWQSVGEKEWSRSLSEELSRPTPPEVAQWRIRAFLGVMNQGIQKCGKDLS